MFKGKESQLLIISSKNQGHNENELANREFKIVEELTKLVPNGVMWRKNHHYVVSGSSM